MPAKSKTPPPAPTEPARGKAYSIWLDAETRAKLDELCEAEAKASGDRADRLGSLIIRRLIRRAHAER